jgi:hypothetical protein
VLGAVTPGVAYPGAISYASSPAQPLSDTLVTMSDAIASRRSFQISDTLTSMWDTFFPIQTTTDTLVTITDSLALHNVKTLTDTAATVTDILRKTLQRDIVDTIVTLDDTLTSNNRYAQRIILGGPSGSVGGTTVGATSEPGETLISTVANSGYTLWYQWTAPATGKYRFAVRPNMAAYPLANPWLQVYRYDPGAVIPQLGFVVVSNDEATWSDVSQENDAVVNLYVEAGETFVIQVGAWNFGKSSFTLEWFEITLAPDYDDFPGRTLANFDIINGNLEWCTAEPGDPRSWLTDFFYFGDPIDTPNRSGIFKATAEVNGTMAVTFIATDTSYELNLFVFDGAGVTSIADLTEDKLVTFGYVFDGTFEVPVIGGRDYFIYLLSDRPWDSPDALFRMRVAWPSVTGGAMNDDFENLVDLDDNLWHAATTDSATDESFPAENPNSPAFKYDPSPRTVWFKASYGADTSQFHVESRFASQNLLYEWYGLRESDEYLRSLVDTMCTVTDGITVDPRVHWEIADTLVTQSEAILLKVTRALNDRLVTMSDVVQKGPADTLATMSDTLTRTVVRRMTDTLTFTSSHFVTRRVARGRSVADTLATVSDSLAILNLRRFDLTDTAVTPGDSLARSPIVYSRSIVASAMTMSDSLTRIPPVTVTDTITTMSDSVATPTITRGRALADRIVLMDDFIATNHPRVQDWAIESSGFSFITTARRVTRTVTDTIATISDSANVT